MLPQPSPLPHPRPGEFRPVAVCAALYVSATVAGGLLPTHRTPCPRRTSGRPVSSSRMCGWKGVRRESQPPNNNMEKMLKR